jgi:hypothetical protein
MLTGIQDDQVVLRTQTSIMKQQSTARTSNRIYRQQCTKSSTFGGMRRREIIQHPHPDTDEYAYEQLVLRIRTKRADDLPSAPDLLIVDLLQLFGKVLAVSRATVELERLAGLGTVLNALIQLLEHGYVGLLEDRCPVERTAASGGRAGVVHVVHTGSI